MIQPASIILDCKATSLICSLLYIFTFQIFFMHEKFAYDYKQKVR